VISREAPHLLVVGGAMRSGTTLLQHLLDSHPQVRLMARELRALRYADLATWAHVAAVLKHFASERESMRHEQFRGQVYRYLRHILRGGKLNELATVDRVHNALSGALADADTLYVGDKYPDYVLHCAQFIYRPNTRCVFTYRDPRDMVASLVERIQRGPWRGRQWTKKYDTIDKATNYWVHVMQILRAVQGVETNALLIRYEELVLRTAETIGLIARHLQLPNEGFDRSLPDPFSIGRYRERLSDVEVQAIERHAAPMMEAWGYTRGHA
jgi:hypothetical protein